ncbi:DUF262 domain-containing protein [Campylobacterota bacterium DY0563]
MALLKDELEISKIIDILKINLTLPSYQRPYSWSINSCNTLFFDIYEAFNSGIDEYRIGSIILHKENSGKYNIVDGQQRLTTLSILLYSLGDINQNLLKEKYSKLSNNAIILNYRILSKRIKELNEREIKKFKEYLLKKCTIVKIVTNTEQEAFQFFDSQNSRGKELAPHDLLKSYHLREMKNEDEEEKIKIINCWENIKQEYLYDLFKNYLYPLINWYKRKDGLGYSSSKINYFKGIKGVNNYNYSIYHKASNLYVEQINSNGINELISPDYINQFQLTQPLIAGRRFFNYSLHYGKLLEKIQERINHLHKRSTIPSKRSGDIYIKQLYECSLLFYTDRFGLENLSSYVMHLLYSWCYSLRLTMNAVYQQTINKYAKGQHDRVNLGIDMFAKINEMSDPEELKMILLTKPDIHENNKSKYKAIYEFIFDWNGWKK